VSRSSVPQRRLGAYDQPKQFWLVSLLHSLLVVVTAYLVALSTFLIVVHLSELPSGPLWDDSFRSALVFVLVVAAAVVILIPYFQKEWDRGTRLFSILAAFFLLAFASLNKTGIADPKTPLAVMSTHLFEPLRHFLNF